MAQGKRPDYEAFVSEKGADDKNHYTRIGAAWKVKNDGISIKLKAIPIDGSLVLFPPRDEE